MKISLADITLIIIDCINLERAQIALDICQKNIRFGEVKLLTHFEDPDVLRIVKINKIDTIKKYSNFCLKELNNYIDTDYCLLIQYDGFILNPEKWTDKFLEYDYIGCVDTTKVNKELVTKEDDRLVGNGGFSLRSKKLLNILQNTEEIDIEKSLDLGEDYIISSLYRDFLKGKGIRFAQKDIANLFATNTTDQSMNSKDAESFGFHGLKMNLDYFLSNNPEFVTIKKYFKKEVGLLKYFYSRTLKLFDKSPFLYKFIRKILLFVKKIYYKLFY